MSGRMLQHDSTVGGRHCWTSGQVMLLQQQPQPALQLPTAMGGYIHPQQGYHRRSQNVWPTQSIMDNQLEALGRRLQSCIVQLINQGFNESEARLSLLRHRFNVEAASEELHHAAFMRKLQRASQTRAELGYVRSDVYRCGHKCLQRYQPCLPSIFEANSATLTSSATVAFPIHERAKSSFT
ncbi:hypothetical protein BOX15_Mlig031655g3 [Macrostomum lignano]|uniref:UBA domain-containing protein n=1 Tax=Macrostomum lignano TaxID=282301 RepID=A0A267H491_9PLAT|nr:hypothetical protein BOX15_Mlig031655g3 [Macrostomum lignano]